MLETTAVFPTPPLPLVIENTRVALPEDNPTLPVSESLPRITSYNVCYTKLLRLIRAASAPDGMIVVARRITARVNREILPMVSPVSLFMRFILSSP